MTPRDWTNQDIVLYHGTLLTSAHDIFELGIDTSRGQPNADFGRAFYTTTSLNQARAFAEKKSAGKGRAGILRLRLDRLVLGDLRTLAFVRGNLDAVDYWSFVDRCRERNEVPLTVAEHYDVVYGPVAGKWGQRNRFAFHGYDQIAFCGERSQTVLRDPEHCTLEVML